MKLQPCCADGRNPPGPRGWASAIKRTGERLTGWARPAKGELPELCRARKPTAFRFQDGGLVPNHPAWPLVLYRSAVRLPDSLDSAAVLEDLFESHGWGDSWRDGIYGSGDRRSSPGVRSARWIVLSLGRSTRSSAAALNLENNVVESPPAPSTGLPCENSVAFVTRGKLVRETAHKESRILSARDLRGLFENYVFYIFDMYEFSHSLGHKATYAVHK